MQLEPMVPGSGFRMEGYYVWCGSVVKDKGTYWLFAARWPEEDGFPWGYLKASEIVLASTDDLRRPFVYRKTILTAREGQYWDSVMQHNPTILRVGEKWVLFYIGSPDGGTENRRIGYAVADHPEGPWQRSDKPLDLPPDSNNPAVVVEKDGVWLYFRDGDLHVYAAKAPTLAGPYEILSRELFPLGRVEDMFVYPAAEGYAMIAEDAEGAYTGLRKGGVEFTSRDGVHWETASREPAYTFHVECADGSSMELQRRERPFLLRDETGVYLFTAAKLGGPNRIEGGHTWNLVQKVAE